MDRLAKGIAVALGRPELRRRLLEDLRDSPAPRNKLHLNSYLRRERGREVAAVAAAVAGIEPEELLAGLRGASALELWLPIALDRARWSGSDSVVVAGSARPRTEVLRTSLFLRGHRTSGEAVEVPLQARNPYALLAIFPRSSRSGPTRRPPGARRRGRRGPP